MGAMIEGGWRVEHGASVAAHNRSADFEIGAALDQLKGLTVVAVRGVGSPPEMEIDLSDGTRISTSSEDEPDPQWTVFDRRLPKAIWLHVRKGRFAEDAAEF